jgi:hypothetical protein
VEFPAIGCAAPLSEIYRKVALTATP